MNEKQMKIFNVTQTTTVTLIHRIKACSSKDAIDRMVYGHSTTGQVFLDIIEDDSEVEYEVEEVPENDNS